MLVNDFIIIEQDRHINIFRTRLVVFADSEPINIKDAFGEPPGSPGVRQPVPPASGDQFPQPEILEPSSQAKVPKRKFPS